MQCQSTFSSMHIFDVLSGCLVVMWDRTHTGIRRTLSLHSEHVYKDNVWVKMSVKINYCAIFRCTTNNDHHRQHIFILRFLTNKLFKKKWHQVFHGSLSELQDRHHLWLVFKVIVSIAATMTWPTPGHIHHKQIVWI